jgi:UDP-GlcNAc:undecaprenyl-phosphate GlcNAc-1-phosphate transferase
LITFLTSLVICLVLTPAVIRFAARRKWFDLPDDRKIHSESVPRLGGVAIMGSFLIAIFLSAGPDTLLHTRYFLAGLLILFFLGLWDDLQPVSPYIKLLGEFLPALLLTYSVRLPLTYFSLDLQLFEWPVTIIAVLWIINAFNLVDGINGLAASIGLVSLLGMAFLGSTDVAFVSLAFAGALLGFLYYNFTRPKIFMGDGGSLPLGYVLAFCITRIFTDDLANSTLDIGKVLTVVALMSLPLFDMVRVFFIRLIKGNNPFVGDRKHLHHLMLEAGCTHVWATLILVFISLILALSVWFLQKEISFPVEKLLVSFAFMSLTPLVFTLAVWMRVRKIRIRLNVINVP